MTDYTVGDTIYHKFTTRAFATGVPATLAGTPVVSIYEDSSTTQITAGITLTADFDSVTGLNHLTVVATGGNGFEIGKFYQAVITTGTVGGVSVVGETIWTFSLGASAAAQDLANGTDGLGAIKTDTAAILVDTGTTLPATLSTLSTQTSVNTIDTNVDSILVDTGTTIPAQIAAQNDFNPATDTVANVTLVATTTTNTDMRGTDSALLAASINLTAGAVDNVTTVATTTTNTDMRGTDSAATATALATVDTNVDAILVDTGTDIPARFDGVEGATFATGTDSLEAIRDRGDSAWVTGAGGSSPTVAQIVDGVWDELQSAHTTASTFGKFLDVEVSSISGTGLTSQQTRDAMKLAPTGGAPATGSIDEHLDDILEDTGTTLPATLATLSTASALATVDTNVDAILVDTGTTLPATLATLSTASALATVDGNVDSILVDTGTTIPAQITGLNDFNPATDTVVTVTTTGTVTDGAKATALATVDTNVDAILVDTGTTLPAQITALNDITAADVLAAGDADGFSLEESLKLLLSASTGILSGAATSTIIIKAADGSKTRLTATVDVDGNRSVVVKDATG